MKIFVQFANFGATIEMVPNQTITITMCRTTIRITWSQTIEFPVLKVPQQGI